MLRRQFLGGAGLVEVVSPSRCEIDIGLAQEDALATVQLPTTDKRSDIQRNPNDFWIFRQELTLRDLIYYLRALATTQKRVSE